MGEMNRIVENMRKNCIDMIYKAGAPHIGSALSCIEILAAVYSVVDTLKIKNMDLDRDRIILSKGHAIAAQLAALNEFGISEIESDKFCGINTTYFENTSPFTPYVEAATGSLGQGASFAAGVALGMKCLKQKESMSYVVIGDGELNEGQNWEAFLQAACLQLGNYVVLIDNNGLAGINKTCTNMMWKEKFASFGFNVSEVNGHNTEKIIAALRKLDKQAKKPHAIICNTIKGNGISFMENENVWHYRPISEETYQLIIQELEEKNER